jgi:hypothetical protein
MLYTTPTSSAYLRPWPDYLRKARNPTGIHTLSNMTSLKRRRVLYSLLKALVGFGCKQDQTVDGRRKKKKKKKPQLARAMRVPGIEPRSATKIGTCIYMGHLQ